MLIKVKKLGPSFGTPNVVEKNGELSMQAEMLGELIKVPEPFREAAELLVGELTMSVFPIGIEVELTGELENLNGLWVGRDILKTVRNAAAAAA
jgi:hypothetical protein